jgi:hypothetical protein
MNLFGVAIVLLLVAGTLLVLTSDAGSKTKKKHRSR